MPRKTHKIKSKKTILLIVEGYTEKIYFSQMKFVENNQNVTIIPRMAKHSSLITILETAIKEAKRFDIQFADSLPAFEIWFLLHYVLPKQYYKNQDELITELQKHINNYNKDINWLSKENLYTKLKPLVLNAIDNSIRLEQRNLANQTNETSMCNVYKLIKSILEEK